jgi:dATP pyrophosphohydrolase
MTRAPFQVLVLPYRRMSPDRLVYAVFSRVDYLCWQFLAGGGEEQESPLMAAKREAYEEAGIDRNRPFLALDSKCSIPVYHFRESRNWGEEIFVVTEYAFGVDVGGSDFQLSVEHNEVLWLPYTEAYARLTYDSNRTALWELNQRLLGKGPRD